MEACRIHRPGEFAFDRPWIAIQLAGQQFGSQRRPDHAAGGKPEQCMQAGFTRQSVE
jgi:hypothetical protein